MEPIKQRLELFMLRYKEMRASQNNYFKNSNSVNLKIAKAKELDCDALYKQLRKEGFDPENANHPVEQKNLFK